MRRWLRPSGPSACGPPRLSSVWTNPRAAAADKVAGEGGPFSEQGGGSFVALPQFRGDRLLVAREAAGLSRADVTVALDLSTPYRVLQWESGNERPQPRFFPRLADLLGIDPVHLLEVDPADPPLAALRLAAGLSTDEMGAPGMSVMTYQRLESGRRTVAAPPSIVQTLADTLNVDPQRIESAIRRSQRWPNPVTPG